MANINITVPENLTEDEIADFIHRELTKHNVDVSTLYMEAPPDWNFDTGVAETTVHYDYSHFGNTTVTGKEPVPVGEHLKVNFIDNTEDIKSNAVESYLRMWKEFVKIEEEQNNCEKS